MAARVIDPMGFAVNPGVVNQPVALEVDTARQRQLRTWMLATLVVIAAACFNGWQRGRVVDHARQLGDLQRQHAAAVASSQHLRVEYEVLREPSRIARFAERDLHLVSPGVSDVVVIQRVVPPEQPPSSVVASR